MRRKHRRLAFVAVFYACTLLVQTGMPIHVARAEHAQRVHEIDGGYNAEYIFATTRGLVGLDAPPALKVTLVPVTLVMDVALLPFEFLAGCF